jgi:hypothetical protein
MRVMKAREIDLETLQELEDIKYTLISQYL